jgi:hypothetical protein
MITMASQPLITQDTRVKSVFSSTIVVPIILIIFKESAQPWTSQLAKNLLPTAARRPAGPRSRFCYLPFNSVANSSFRSQGSPQYIQLSFSSPVLPRRISLTFQGGFVGIRCSLNVQSLGADGWASATRIYPEDVNRKQTFDIDIPDPVLGLKLVFEESSDFFGRITVYDLSIDGTIPI